MCSQTESSKNNAKRIWYSVLIAVCVVAVVFCVYKILRQVLPKDISVTANPVQITGNEYNYINNLQVDAHVVLFSHEGRLYYYQRTEPTPTQFLKGYEGTIFRIDKGRLAKTGQADMVVVGARNHYLYGFRPGEGKNYIFYDYDFISNNATSYAKVDYFCYHPAITGCIFAQDGTIYFPDATDVEFNEYYTNYYSIKDSEFSQPEAMVETYVSDMGTYTIRKGEQFGDVYFQAKGSEEQVKLDIPGGNKFFIPVEQGVLVYCYNNVHTTLLYLIRNDTGEIVKLFHNDEKYVARQAINVYGEYVYLSVDLSAGDVLGTVDPDDPMQGTFRISLQDYSIEEIARKPYCGLYIFDDTGIYVCDEKCNVTKLDFDGNVIDEIVKYVPAI